MKNENLDRLLQELAAASPPAPCTDSFRHSVWREIRHRKALGSDVPSCPGWMEMFLPFWSLRTAAVMLVLALIVGSATAYSVSIADRNSHVASQALHLDAFSASANGLPANSLITKR